jgi:uncharacterized membrane protein
MPDLLKRWYPAGLALLAAAVSCALWSRLPDRMVVHWDLAGNPNGWMPRPIGAFFAPVMMLVMWGILRGTPRIDPRRENFEKFRTPYDITVAALLALLFVLHLLMLALGVGYDINIGVIAPVLVGIVFVVLGNFLPLARPNFMYGIRTPWTLSSDRVWMRTHRLGGYTTTAAGFAMIAAALLLPTELAIAVVVAAVVAASVGPVVYSYLTWKREKKQ